jgi:DNA repair exonuclease SbcCD ATPase subunit
MILIERLAAHNFKQLRDIDLALPPSCRVLVEGLNEAGKSTLFEAIHFALYGRGLVTRGRGQGATDSLIAYGANRASVAVALRIDGQSLQITRTLRRGRTGEAACEVRGADGITREVSQIRQVNQDVLVHLSGLDSDALLASCLVEQKKLGKLEELTREKRQEVLLKLLDLDRLTRVKRHFGWDRREDLKLQDSEQKLRLAEAVRRIDELARELIEVERQITLARIALNLAEADGYAAQADCLCQQLDVVSKRLAEVQYEITLTENLDRTIGLLQKLLEADAAASQCLVQAEEYDRDLTRLDAIERETIPGLRAEAQALQAIGSRLGQIAELDAEAGRLREQKRQLAAGVLDAAGNELDDRSRIAIERVQRASLVETLREWGAAAREANSRQRGDAVIAELDRAAAAAETEHHAVVGRVNRMTLILGISVAVVLAGVLGLALSSISIISILAGAGLLA